jgi:hypothetical protein
MLADRYEGHFFLVYEFDNHSAIVT